MDLSVIKEVGFPIALCVVLIYAIKAQNTQLVRAFTDRIKTLESVVKDQGVTIEEHRKEIAALQHDRLVRADEYARTLKDIAGRYAKVVTDHDAWSKQAFNLLSRLIDTWSERPCMTERYDPHPSHPGHLPPRSPSSADLPLPPTAPPTEGHFRHA